MRSELSRLHERLGVTTIYVTHDQVEAMTLGQRVAVMRDGVIQQVDSPQALYTRPDNLFVAAFIGSPAMNLVEAVVADGRVSFAGSSCRSTGAPVAGRQGDPRHPAGGFEDAALADPGLPTVDVDVLVLEELGSDTHVIFPIDAPRVEAEDIKAAADDEEEGLLARRPRRLERARRVEDARRGRAAAAARRRPGRSSTSSTRTSGASLDAPGCRPARGEPVALSSGPRAVIPKPVSMTPGSGAFVVRAATTVVGQPVDAGDAARSPGCSALKLGPTARSSL